MWLNRVDWDFSGGPVAKSVLTMQGPPAQPLVRELALTHHNEEFTWLQLRVRVPQLRCSIAK